MTGDPVDSVEDRKRRLWRIELYIDGLDLSAGEFARMVKATFSDSAWRLGTDEQLRAFEAVLVAHAKKLVDDKRALREQWDEQAAGLRKPLWRMSARQDEPPAERTGAA